MTVTVTGGHGCAGANLGYSDQDLANIQSQIYSSSIHSANAEGSASWSYQSSSVSVASGGYWNVSTVSGGNTAEFSAGNTWKFTSTTQDTTTMSGAGADTVGVSCYGTSEVVGPAKSLNSGLTYASGPSGTKIDAGHGSFTIYGGSGGGEFTGGDGGHNLIFGGEGATTITGGGDGDTLLGGYGNTVITAGAGNETLGGGYDTTAFDLSGHSGKPGYGANTDTIYNYTTKDWLNIGGPNCVNLALNTYHVADGNGSFMLNDGSKVVLEGYTGHLSSGNFKS